MPSLNDLLNMDIGTLVTPLWKKGKWLGIRAGIGIALGLAYVGHGYFASDSEPDKITSVFETESEGSQYIVIEQGDIKTPFIQTGDKYTRVIDDLNKKYDNAERKVSELWEKK